MPLPSDHNAPSPKGTGAAWLGGILGAAAAASLAFFPAVFPGDLPWQALGLQPGRPVPPSASLAASLAVGLASVWITLRIIPLRRIFPLLGTAALLIITQSGVLAMQGWHWMPWPALLALVAGAGTTLLLRPAFHGPASFFHGRLAPAQVAALGKVGDLSFLQPDQREATVLTCRLLNENALREMLPAPDFLKLCAAFRSRASAILLNHGACLDPAEPNGVRAFFGLPFATAAPADESVKAALALDEAMQAFFSTLSSPPPERPVCGIGLATGTLTAGLTGSTYTVLGDAVELSRWLSAQNSLYQTRLLLDAATHRAADAVEDRPLEFINPPDGAAVEIFQLLGTTGSLSREALARRNAFRDAIMLLRAGHAEDAARRFGDARSGLTTPDPVLEYFVSQSQDQTRRDAASTGPLSPGSGPTPAPPAASSRRAGKAGRKLPRRP
jgi:class 3 adenylate cyclase